MDSAKLNDWAQVVGIFALVASLIFVGMQMRQDQEIAIVNALSLRVETTAEAANLISDNRDIWVRAINGQDLPAEDEAVVESLLDVVENHYTNLFVRYARIGPFPQTQLYGISRMVSISTRHYGPSTNANEHTIGAAMRPILTSSERMFFVSELIIN